MNFCFCCYRFNLFVTFMTSLLLLLLLLFWCCWTWSKHCGSCSCSCFSWLSPVTSCMCCCCCLTLKSCCWLVFLHILLVKCWCSVDVKVSIIKLKLLLSLLKSFSIFSIFTFVRGHRKLWVTNSTIFDKFLTVCFNVFDDYWRQLVFFIDAIDALNFHAIFDTISVLHNHLWTFIWILLDCLKCDQLMGVPKTAYIRTPVRVRK